MGSRLRVSIFQNLLIMNIMKYDGMESTIYLQVSHPAITRAATAVVPTDAKIVVSVFPSAVLSVQSVPGHLVKWMRRPGKDYENGC